MSGVVKILVLTLRNCADSYDTQNQTYLITKIAIFIFLSQFSLLKKCIISVIDLDKLVLF